MKVICPGDSNTYGYDPRSWLGAWVSGPWEIEDSLAFAEGCRALAGRLGILFAGADRWEIPLAYDGVHFTEQGHRAFAQALFETLESLEVLK